MCIRDSLKDDETGEITYLNNIGLNNEEILQNVKSGNFVVALCSEMCIRDSCRMAIS